MTAHDRADESCSRGPRGGLHAEEGQAPSPTSMRGLTSSSGQSDGIDPLAGCDLNLLVVLNALLEERHVTRAGNRLALSQPATSSALKRLRRMFDDPLLTKHGNEMVLSPRAYELRAAVGEALSAVRIALRTSMPFYPASTAITARIDTTDYSLLRLFPSLQHVMQREAPGITLKVEQHSAFDTLNRLRTDQLDMAIGQFFGHLPPSVHREHLFYDDFVCVMREGHPALEPGTTSDTVLPLDELLKYPHLRVPSLGTVTGVVADALARRHLNRRIACEIPNMLVAPFILAETDMVAFLPKAIVDRCGALVSLTTRIPEIEINGFWTELIWHARSDNEPAHRWLRDRLSLIARPPATGDPADERGQSADARALTAVYREDDAGDESRLV